MRERPIIFGGESVRAILAGRKTQTRRVVDLARADHRVDWIGWVENRTAADGPDLGPGWEAQEVWESTPSSAEELADSTAIRCPYGVVGDRLWVRETWCEFDHVHWEDTSLPKDYLSLRYGTPRRNACAYRAETDADGERIRADYGYQWKTPLFMPRWASRLTLEVTEVRVERLQSISGADAIAEIGCVGTGPNNHRHVDQYRRAWDSLNARRGFPWSSDPWVWCVTFQNLSP